MTNRPVTEVSGARSYGLLRCLWKVDRPALILFAAAAISGCAEPPPTSPTSDSRFLAPICTPQGSDLVFQCQSRVNYSADRVKRIIQNPYFLSAITAFEMPKIRPDPKLASGDSDEVTTFDYDALEVVRSKYTLRRCFVGFGSLGTSVGSYVGRPGSGRKESDESVWAFLQDRTGICPNSKCGCFSGDRSGVESISWANGLSSADSGLTEIRLSVEEIRGDSKLLTFDKTNVGLRFWFFGESIPVPTTEIMAGSVLKAIADIIDCGPNGNCAPAEFHDWEARRQDKEKKLKAQRQKTQDTLKEIGAEELLPDENKLPGYACNSELIDRAKSLFLKLDPTAFEVFDRHVEECKKAPSELRRILAAAKQIEDRARADERAFQIVQKRRRFAEHRLEEIEQTLPELAAPHERLKAIYDEDGRLRKELLQALRTATTTSPVPKTAMQDISAARFSRQNPRFRELVQKFFRDESDCSSKVFINNNALPELVEWGVDTDIQNKLLRKISDCKRSSPAVP